MPVPKKFKDITLKEASSRANGERERAREIKGKERERAQSEIEKRARKSIRAHQTHVCRQEAHAFIHIVNIY